MKVYKIEVCIIDLDEIDDEVEIKTVIENTKYPNRCISPEVIKIDSVDIGEWSDDHPLNYTNTFHDEYKRLFSTTK